MVYVLHITGALEAGGVETMLYNYYKYMNREKVKFDFVVFGAEEGPYEKKFKELGANVYHIAPLNKKNIIKHLSQLKDIIEFKRKYQVVHVHRNMISYIYLILARLLNIPVRIVHGHSVDNVIGKTRIIKNFFYRKLNRFFATNYFACSLSVAKYMFGEKLINKGDVVLINNAIDLSEFKYNQITKEEIRNNYNLIDKYVIGNVARFSELKNHNFLIEVFYEVNKIDENCVLLLIGEGELEDSIKEKVNQLELDSKVLFLGARFDIPRLLHAIDLFVLPSKLEGLGIVLIEAQAVGIKCLVSDNVPKEVNITHNIEYLSLNMDSKYWADTIINIQNKRELHGFETEKLLANAGFDISLESRKLEDFYLSLRIQETYKK
jgi:glycosyltransferase involved in cell wall biosynthesis